MDIHVFNRQLLDYIGRSVTPFHAVWQMQQALDRAGYRQLDEQDHWGQVQGRYYVIRDGGSIIAFVVNEDVVETGIQMAAAHTDSPALKVKPNPVLIQQGYLQLGVEVYGGVLLNPWFDRDLSLAGRVSARTPSGQLQSRLINFAKPLAHIPSLAIHLDRQANTERRINAQTDIVPVLMPVDQASDFDFLDRLKQQWMIEHGQPVIDQVLDYELSFYDCQPPILSGIDQVFISGARLDNLLSCFATLSALIDAKGNGNRLLVCHDHEEVGSVSSSGAQGSFLHSVLTRIAGGSQASLPLIDRSMMISCDNAHAIHPNYPNRHDHHHAPRLNEGLVIKSNANQRYAGDSQMRAYFRDLCARLAIPVQDFVTRTDLACGSTIGPITAARVGVKTIDVGIAQWAMHSIRETCGSQDPYRLYQVLARFYEAG